MPGHHPTNTDEAGRREGAPAGEGSTSREEGALLGGEKGALACHMRESSEMGVDKQDMPLEHTDNSCVA